MTDDIVLCYYTSDAAKDLHDAPLVITCARMKDDIQMFMTPTPTATSTTSLIPVVW